MIITLTVKGKSNPEIFKQVKPLGVSRTTVWNTLKRHKELATIDDRSRSGHPRTKRTPEVCEMIRLNPCHCQSDLARWNPMTMNWLIKSDLVMESYCLRHAQVLSKASKIKSKVRCKVFLDHMCASMLLNLTFSDEKMFVVEAKHYGHLIRPGFVAHGGQVHLKAPETCWDDGLGCRQQGIKTTSYFCGKRCQN